MFHQVRSKPLASLHTSGGPVLQLSMRRVHDLVAYCGSYEFEDVVAEVTASDRVEVLDYEAVERARRAYKLGRAVTGSTRVASALSRTARAPRMNREYELFFPIFNDPFELFALAAVPDWRARCRIAACFICELWAHNLPEYLLELLSGFDHVFTGVQHPVEEVSRITGKPCTYLPLAADVLRFAPPLWAAPRVIDVCNVGRRSSVTHAALLELARHRRIFYYYDTVRASGYDQKQVTFRVRDVEEHRLLLANVLQRSRYYVANRSRVNEPEANEREEISARFYEGIAAGAVLIGEAPRSLEFRRQFDWNGAVVPLPFDSPDAGEVLARLDADPAREEAIRRQNVRQAALRHDWLHRVQTVFETMGIRATAAMNVRANLLGALAKRDWLPVARRRRGSPVGARRRPGAVGAVGTGYSHRPRAPLRADRVARSRSGSGV
jgi:Glycosyl transferases group 1